MKLTVFTPTYNRADCLFRLYQSLCRQTLLDFEWLIVDDGSEDHTEETVKTMMTEAKFSIRYIRKENGGKHTAYNRALETANGEYFFCVDSDDWLTDSAIERIVLASREIKDSAGFLAYKSLPDGNRLSAEFPQGVSFCHMRDIPVGEYSIIMKTDIAIKYPFPVYEGEKFVGESVIYDRIDCVYTFVLLPNVLTVCEYQADGYSASYSNLMRNNPTGYCLYFSQRIDLACNLKQRLTVAAKYHAFRIFSSKRLRYSGPHKKTVALALPLGWLFWLYYKLFRGF